jgi:hypothetical protein
MLSLSLGRTAHTSERFWVAIEFIELRPGVADRDLWKAWELLSAEGAKAPQERQHGRPPPLL